MRKWTIIAVAALLGVSGLAGCRMPGNSGYRELNEEEVSNLASMARGSLLRVKSKVRRPNQPARPLLLQNQAAIDYVRTELPQYKIQYTGDYKGRATFEWPFDGWVYQVQAIGNLRGSLEEIHWSYAVKPPPRVSGEKAELWDGPGPDELMLYYSDDPTGMSRHKDGKLEFDLGPAQAPGVSVEGAVSK